MRIREHEQTNIAKITCTFPVAGFTISGQLHVFLLFMPQFMFVLALFGIAIPEYYNQGVHVVILGLGGALMFVAFHFFISALGRLLPIRCRQCNGRSYFGGFKWWPFEYRYECAVCGTNRNFEVG